MHGFAKVSISAAALAAMAFLTLPAAAQVVTESENMSCGNDAASEAIAKIESGGDYTVVNSYGFLGKYQIGEGKLRDLGYAVPDGNYRDNRFQWSQKAYERFGIRTNQDFLNNPQAQETIFREMQDLSVSYLGSAMNSVGQTMSCGGSPTTITKSSLLAGSQLGEGRVQEYIRRGMSCEAGRNTSTNDANGVCVEKFMCAVAGCNPIEKDMSKKTCDVTMPMIEAISCSNMPSNLQGFCSTYRPYLMTRAECTDAEQMAEAAPKGPNREKCENLTFGVGTGSWSWVLACSYASDAVADQDGESNPTGPVTDPACMANLESMGVQFDKIGQMTNGSASGRTCIVENAVALSRTTTVDFGQRLVMTCEMATAMEQFGQQISGLGVTAYHGVSATVPCRPMRDRRGDRPGTVSEHGLGRAMDISAFIVGGRKVDAGALLNPGTPDGQIVSAIKAASCSSFRGVLSPTYEQYQGAYAHFHVEWGAGTFCR